MKAILDIESQFKQRPCYLKQAWQRSPLKPYWPLLLVPLALLLTQTIGYSINLTGSLPQKFWLIVYKKTPRKGDYILFKPLLDAEVPQGTLVIKQVIGLPGDTIIRVEQDFFINNDWIATAKKRSLKGLPLSPGPTGVLAPGQYFVLSHHPDSFDSRYQKMGWIKTNQIIGVAYPLW